MSLGQLYAVPGVYEFVLMRVDLIFFVELVYIHI